MRNLMAVHFCFVPTIWNTGNGTIRCGQQSHLVICGSAWDLFEIDGQQIMTCCPQGSRSEGI